MNEEMPIVIESTERINELLLREFGRHDDNRAKFRVVWSNDQMEKRWVTHSPEGFEYVNPKVEERPKYRQWCNERFVLEQLSIIPEGVETDLIGKLSYEPLWVFQDVNGKALPPRFDACKLIIENMYLGMEAAAKKFTQYKDDPQKGAKEIKEVQEALFGDETAVGDALAYGWGVTVPGMPPSDKIH